MSKELFSKMLAFLLEEKNYDFILALIKSDLLTRFPKSPDYINSHTVSSGKKQRVNIISFVIMATVQSQKNPAQQEKLAEIFIALFEKYWPTQAEAAKYLFITIAKSEHEFIVRLAGRHSDPFATTTTLDCLLACTIWINKHYADILLEEYANQHPDMLEKKLSQLLLDLTNFFEENSNKKEDAENFGEVICFIVQWFFQNARKKTPEEYKEYLIEMLHLNNGMAYSQIILFLAMLDHEKLFRDILDIKCKNYLLNEKRNLTFSININASKDTKIVGRASTFSLLSFLAKPKYFELFHQYYHPCPAETGENFWPSLCYTAYMAISDDGEKFTFAMDHEPWLEYSYANFALVFYSLSHMQRASLLIKFVAKLPTEALKKCLLEDPYIIIIIIRHGDLACVQKACAVFDCDQLDDFQDIKNVLFEIFIKNRFDVVRHVADAFVTNTKDPGKFALLKKQFKSDLLIGTLLLLNSNLILSSDISRVMSEHIGQEEISKKEEKHRFKVEAEEHSLLTSLANILLKLDVSQEAVYNRVTWNTVIVATLNNLEVFLKKLLLDMGMDPRQGLSRHALPLAAYFDFWRCVTILLSANADPLFRSKFGLTALEYAIQGNHCKSAGIILSYLCPQPEMAWDDDALQKYFIDAFKMVLSNQTEMQSLLSQYIHPNRLKDFVEKKKKLYSIPLFPRTVENKKIILNYDPVKDHVFSFKDEKNKQPCYVKVSQKVFDCLGDSGDQFVANMNFVNEADGRFGYRLCRVGDPTKVGSHEKPAYKMRQTGNLSDKRIYFFRLPDNQALQMDDGKSVKTVPTFEAFLVTKHNKAKIKH